MAKWFLITCLLVTFCSFRADRPVQRAACKSSGTIVTGHHSEPPSFSEAMRTYPLSRLVSGALLVPDSGCHQGTGSYVAAAGPSQVVASNRGREIIADALCDEPVLKDHFDHLFPFFHFW